MSNGQGNSGKMVPLLLGLVIGVAVGIGVAQMMKPGEKSEDGPRGLFHDRPSPTASPERTVQMNLTELRDLNAASDPAQNPHKDAIQMKVDQLLDPAFESADPMAPIHAHNAWFAAKHGVWAASHDELNEIH